MSASEQRTTSVTSRPARATSWWSMLYGPFSLYWAAGGEMGVSTLAQTSQDQGSRG